MANETTPDVRRVAHRFRGELWNSGDLSHIDEVVAPTALIHARVPFPIDFARGPEALRQLVFFYHLAFSDIRMNVEQLVVEGEMAVVRWTGRGRHTGDLLGLPATGRETVTTGIDMLRIVDGKVVEGWVAWDALTLLEQLVAPADGTAALAEPIAGAGFLPLLSRLLG